MGELPPTELYPADYKVFLKRCCQVLVHELGHLFGLEHCIHFECVMNGADSLVEGDRAPMHLCPICLRKLDYGINKSMKCFDAMSRYSQMAKFYEKHGFGETDWVNRRMELI